MKELKKTETIFTYNYFKTMGWVVILRNNKPVNFHADHGEVDTDYYCVNKIFKTMVSELQDVLQITEIINVFNHTAEFIYDTYKVDTVI